ncbi:MAG: hypothetical protein WB565_17955 [Acidimicrobiales bacterium]
MFGFYKSLFWIMDRRLRRIDEPLPAFGSPLEFRDRLSGAALQSIENAGGEKVLMSELADLETRSLPEAASLMTIGSRKWGGRVEVTGFEAVRQSTEKNGAIIVEPHLGVNQFISGFMMLNGLRVAGFSLVTPNRSRVYRWLQEAIVAPGIGRDAYVEIPVPSPRAMLDVLKLLRDGVPLIWNPVAFSRKTTDIHPLMIEFMGAPVGASPIIPKLLKRVKADLYLSYCLLRDDGVDLHFEPMSLSGESEAEQVGEIYSKVEKTILGNVTQWEGWRYFTNQVLAVEQLGLP